MKIPRQAFTAEFKELAVRRVKDGQVITVAAKELGLSHQTLRNWVKAAATGKLTGAGSKVITPEDMELSKLRAENARLKREVEILKKATAYFARDVLRSTPGLRNKIAVSFYLKCVNCSSRNSKALAISRPASLPQKDLPL
ncbi:transposase [Glaciimonas sp. GG7]